MGREVRMVPKDWDHPKNEKGCYIPLMGGSFAERVSEWDEENALWKQGKRRHFGTGEIVGLDEDQQGMSFEEWEGGRPKPEDYMPKFAEGEATYLMMYEDTTEGTPISPAFETPEELARWLADNGASSFGSDTATYDQWLNMIKAGWAPSMVMTDGNLQSGVEFLTSP